MYLSLLVFLLLLLLLLNPSAYDKLLGSSFCISQVLSVYFPFVLIQVLQMFVSSHVFII